MLTLVRSDLGLAFVPEPMARGNLHRKRILQMNLQEAIPSRSVCLVYDPRRPLNTAARSSATSCWNQRKTNKSKQKASRRLHRCAHDTGAVGFPCFLGVTGLGTQHALQAFQGCKACADGKYTGGVGQLF